MTTMKTGKSSSIKLNRRKRRLKARKRPTLRLKPTHLQPSQQLLPAPRLQILGTRKLLHRHVPHAPARLDSNATAAPHPHPIRSPLLNLNASRECLTPFFQKMQRRISRPISLQPEAQMPKAQPLGPTLRSSKAPSAKDAACPRKRRQLLHPLMHMNQQRLSLKPAVDHFLDTILQTALLRHHHLHVPATSPRPAAAPRQTALLKTTTTLPPESTHVSPHVQ